MEANDKSAPKVTIIGILPGEVCTNVYSPQIGNQLSSGTNTTKVQFGEPINFIEVTCRNRGEGILTGAEMTQIAT